MLAFLKIVAAAFVALVILIVIIVLFIRWKFRSFMAGIMDKVKNEASSGVPPFRITLSRTEEDDEDDSDDSGWSHSDDVRRLTEDMIGAGFTAIGDFDVEELPLKLRAFQHHDHQAYGVIYDHFVAGSWCDVVRRYADDTSWTCSTGKQHGMDSPPHSNSQHFPGESVKTVLDRLLESSPATGYLKAGADTFVRAFESAYSREMNWRIERGGPTEEEIRRISSMGGQECTQEQIDAVQKQWRLAIGQFLSDRMIRSWRKDSGIAQADFEAVAWRTVAVHKRLLPEQILALVDEDFSPEYYSGPDEDEPETLEWERDLNLLREWCREGSAISAFNQLLVSRQLDSKWEKLGSVDKSVRGEIWRRPAVGDEHHDDADDENEFDYEESERV